MKSALLASLALSLPLAALAFARPATDQPLPVATPCANTLPHELLVAYEVSGGGLGGPIDYALAVYSDGVGRLSSYLGDGTGSSQLVSVGAADAQALVEALVAAGAMTACDVDSFAQDVPLSTLTVLRGVARQRANSFSWLGGEGQTLLFEQILNDFVQSHFAPLPGGNGNF